MYGQYQKKNCNCGCSDVYNLHKVVEEDKKVNPKDVFVNYKEPGKKKVKKNKVKTLKKESKKSKESKR